jgi:ribosome-associated toxin RatA of RatAB toxin-antitoxin module
VDGDKVNALLFAAVLSAGIPDWHALDATAAAALVEEGVGAADWEALRNREVRTQRRPIPQDKAGARVAAVAVIDASAERTFSVISDCLRLPEFMPNFEKCTYVEPDEPLPANERWALQELQFRFGPMRVNIAMTQHNELEPPYRLTWQRVRGDTRYNEGYWRVIPLSEDRVVIVYDLLVDAGRAVPGWIQRILTERDLPSVVEVVRDRVENERDLE